MGLKIRKRQLLEVSKEVVPHVVLDVAGGADQDAPHQKAEESADEADGQKQERVLDQFGAGDAAREIVNRVPEYDRRGQRHALSNDDAQEPEKEGLAVAKRVTQQAPEGGHRGSIARPFPDALFTPSPPGRSW